MPLIGALTTFTPHTKAKAGEVNNNFAAIRTAFNESAVLTDVERTITAHHTFAAGATFGATLGAAAITASGSLVAGADPGGTDTIRTDGWLRAAALRAISGGASATVTIENTEPSGRDWRFQALDTGSLRLYDQTGTRVIFTALSSGAMVFGSDPGGSHMVRVGGAARVAGEMSAGSIVTGATIQAPGISRDVSDKFAHGSLGEVQHYGLRWQDDTRYSAGPAAVLSGYGGISLIAQGERLHIAPGGWMTITGPVDLNGELHVEQAFHATGNAFFYANATVTGTLTAGSFSGSGAGLTSLPAGNLVGTIPGSALNGGTYAAKKLTTETVAITAAEGITLSNTDIGWPGGGTFYPPGVPVSVGSESAVWGWLRIKDNAGNDWYALVCTRTGAPGNNTF